MRNGRNKRSIKLREIGAITGHPVFTPPKFFIADCPGHVDIPVLAASEIMLLSFDLAERLAMETMISSDFDDEEFEREFLFDYEAEFAPMEIPVIVMGAGRGVGRYIVPVFENNVPIHVMPRGNTRAQIIESQMKEIGIGKLAEKVVVSTQAEIDDLSIEVEEAINTPKPYYEKRINRRFNDANFNRINAKAKNLKNNNNKRFKC